MQRGSAKRKLWPQGFRKILLGPKGFRIVKKVEKHWSTLLYESHLPVEVDSRWCRWCGIFRCRSACTRSRRRTRSLAPSQPETDFIKMFFLRLSSLILETMQVLNQLIDAVNILTKAQNRSTNKLNTITNILHLINNVLYHLNNTANV